MAVSGSMWIEGEKLCWVRNVSGTTEKYSITGTDEGSVVGSIGSIWIEGNDIAYIDVYGHKRTYELKSMLTEHFPEGAIRGSIWLNIGSYIHIIGYQGEERRMVHHDYTDSTYGRWSDSSDRDAYDDFSHEDKVERHLRDYANYWWHNDYTEQTDYAEWSDHVNSEYQDHSDYGEWTDHDNTPYNEHNRHSDSGGSWEDVPHADHSDYSKWTDHDNTPHGDQSDHSDSGGSWYDAPHADKSKPHRDSHSDSHSDWTDYSEYVDGYRDSWPDHDNSHSNSYSDHSDYSKWTDHDNTPYSEHSDYSESGGSWYDVPHADSTKYNEWTDHTNTPYSEYTDKSDSGGSWEDVPHADHDDHSDEGGSWADAPHSDETFTTHDDHGDYEDLFQYGDLPHLDHFDWQEVAYKDYSKHSDSGGGGHLDTPKLEHADSAV